MFNDIVAMFKKWAEKPLDTNGDVTNWVLFLIFAATVTFFWTRVLRQIKGD